jgi:hypothetical protein
MENVVADAWNVPEAPFVSINGFVVVAVNVEVAKDVSMEDVVKYARYVKEVLFVLTRNGVTVAPSAVVVIYANTVVIKTGVFHVTDPMYANTIKLKHNVLPVMVA